MSTGHKLLETNRGPLDLLGTIEENTGFDELVADSEWLAFCRASTLPPKSQPALAFAALRARAEELRTALVRAA